MLILVLVLWSPIQLAIQANAVVGTLTACGIFVAGVVLQGLMVQFATDADFRQGAADFFWSLPGKIQDGLCNMYQCWESGTKIIGKWTGEQWAELSGYARDYVVNAYSSLDVSPGADGTFGFTADSIFTVELQKDPSGTIQQMQLADCVLTLYDTDNYPTVYSKMPKSTDYLLDDNQHCARYSVFTVPRCNLIFYDIQQQPNPAVIGDDGEPYIDPSKYTGYTGSFSSFDWSKVIDARLQFKTSNNEPINLLCGCNANDYAQFYTIDGVVCYFTRDSNGWGFFDFATQSHVSLVDNDTGDTYDYWDSPKGMYGDVVKLGGFSLPNYKGDVVKPHVKPVGGNIPDVYTGTDDVVIHSPIDKPLDEPTEKDYADVRAANPADIVEQVTTVDRPSDLPDIDSGGLSTKFPFCIPYDLYNLFTGFAGTAAPPKFTIPFKYHKQDDGTYLIDYDIVIDFEQLSDIAYICRWFVGIEFVLGLILATRKLIGAQ